MNEFYICKVYENTKSGQLLVTVPKKSKMKSGDIVKLRKAEVIQEKILMK